MECQFKYDDPCVHIIKGEDRDFCKKSGQFICIETLDTKVPVMSHSSRMSWTRCRQKYYFSKVQGIRVRNHMVGKPLKMGSVIDKFLDSRYHGRPFKQEFKDLCKKYALEDTEKAKCYAIIKAYFDLEVKVELTTKTQQPIKYVTPTCHVKGFLDAYHGDWAEEVKFSGRPDFYRKRENLISQLSTYFLGCPELKYINMKVIRVPGLRFNQDKESYDQYVDRLYTAIISRPSYYFIGWNKLSRTWGEKFHRKEFPIDQIADDYEKMSKDIMQAGRDDSFYQSFNCYCPGECEFLPICRTEGVSEEIYEEIKTETAQDDEGEGDQGKGMGLEAPDEGI